MKLRCGVTLALVALLFAADRAEAQVVQWPGNGHYYEYVKIPGTWTDANAAAEERTFMGVNGHLVSITSAEENAFVTSLKGNGDLRGWIGAFDSGFNDFVWTTGEPFVYQNWSPGEPNGGNIENHVEIFGSGQWNDNTNFTGFNQGYVVEYPVPSNEDPVFDLPTSPACGSTIEWAVGKKLTFQVSASDANAGDVVTLAATLPAPPTTVAPPAHCEPPLPAVIGAFVSPTVPREGNPVSTTFEWTPVNEEVGQHDLVFIARDGEGGLTECRITVIVRRDRDGDGIADLWEIDGVRDSNGNMIVDLPALGAQVDRKDLFVYVDYMSNAEFDHRPSDQAIQTVTQAFANAPVPNPVGPDGINLHVLVSPDPASAAPIRTVPGPTQQFVEFLGATTNGDYRWSRNTPTEAGTFFDDFKNGQLDSNGIEVLRRHFPAELACFARYCMYIHQLNGQDMSGVSRGAPSSDLIVALGAFIDLAAATPRRAGLPLETGTLMHELGHVIGLRHGGLNNTNFKPNYLSVMNYAFQKTGIPVVGGAPRFDFSTVELPALDETSLSEPLGRGNWPAEVQNLVTVWHPIKLKSDGTPDLDPNGEFRYEPFWSEDPTKVGGPNELDWNGNQAINPPATISTINRDDTVGVLNGYDDWANISFTGGTVGAGAPIDLPPTSPLDELDVETAKSIPPPAPQGLAGRSARGTVRLSWIPSGARGGVTYRLFRKESGTPGDPALIATQTSTLYSDRNGLTRGKSYEYSLTVTDSLGAVSNSSLVLTVLVR